MHKIPLTILSRCQRYDFKRISVETIAGRLRELLDREGIKAEERALTYIAKQADGALRDGLSLLEQCISFYFGEELTYEKALNVLGAVDNDVYARFADALSRSDAAELMQMLDEIVAEGKDLTRFCDEWIWYLRNILIVKSTEHPEHLIDMSQENLKTLVGTAEKLELEMVFRYIRVLSEVENQMKYAVQKRVLFEVALIKLCKPEMEKDYDSVINRIHNLEEQISRGIIAAPAQEQEVRVSVKKNAETAVEKKKIRMSAVPEEVRALVGNWNQVLNQLDPVGRNMLRHVTLTVDDRGSLLLAFSEDTSYSYFAGDEGHAELLKEAASDVTGKEVAVEMRLVSDKREYDVLPELRGMFGDSDIEIETVE